MKIKTKINERFLPLILFLLLPLSAFSYADEDPIKPYFIFDSFSFSETVSIESTAYGWKGDNFQSGERQWTWNWIELGVQYQNWAVGVVQRYDYGLQFSKDTAEFYWLIANKRELPTDRQYDVDIQVNAMHSSGLRVSYMNKFSDVFNYRVGLAYLQANYMLDGKLEGNATALSESDYDLDSTVDYYYSEDVIFDRNVAEPKAKGFALDFAFNYQITAATDWQFQVRDLFAKLYWKNAPYTQAKATSDRKEYDENGYVSFNPVLQGFEGTDDTYEQRLAPRWYSKVKHQLSVDYAAVLQLRYQYEHGLFALGADHRISDNNHLGLSYWPINQALELNWDYRKIKLTAAADIINAFDVKTLWLSFSYGI